ncbi:hypothetical protein ACFX13_044918 [Malus domestica]
MQGFRDVVGSCNLGNLGFHGDIFTWANSVMKCRLDRCLANLGWRALFRRSQVIHFPPLSSDHVSILLQVQSSSVQSLQRHRQFRFKESWLQREDYAQVVAAGWAKDVFGTPSYRVYEKIKATRVKLLKWKRSLSSVQQEIKVVRDQMQILFQHPSDGVEWEIGSSFYSKLNSLLTQEEAHWKQLSKTTRQNGIRGLFDESNNWCTSSGDIEQIVVRYFSSMFNSNRESQYDVILNSVPKRVTPEMNSLLCAEYLDEEIKEALFQMDPHTASGPDGLSPLFYQKFWDIVGPDVIAAVKSFLTSGCILKQLNYTMVSLILKVPEPTNMSQHQHIALCNVLYKIGAKVIVNRLKGMMDEIISMQQCAFVPGGLISDNSLVASEVGHYLHNLRRGKRGFLALKLDMSKAYDRVEWYFLKQIMLQLGFDPRWIDLVMSCVSSVTYSFVVNGEVTGYIAPTRGLKQGDPLSPYLFLICVEGLTSLIARYEQLGLIHGVSICRGAPSITHLLFADDNFLFMKASFKECWRDIQDQLAAYLGVTRVDVQDQYLVLPIIFRRNRSEKFAFIKDRLWKKLKGWKEKLLNAAEKEILIKVVGITILSVSVLEGHFGSEINPGKWVLLAGGE